MKDYLLLFGQALALLLFGLMVWVYFGGNSIVDRAVQVTYFVFGWGWWIWRVGIKGLVALKDK